ncbi:MAG: family 78 glycoside hydrolase catalytic domain [Prevotellaceae bacterium]|jgi:alpha-L-rhamnosidase|nr:family 78 glycoside hydrolase catalytic domain [Prevotellaceae bacterium]
MKKYYLTFLLLLITVISGKAQSAVSAVNLRCEYLNNPLGIDIRHPRLSWELISDANDKKQKAYQILVSTDSAALTANRADAWDSKKKNSVQTNQIAYQGKPLKPYTLYFWKVRVWDENGTPSEWSQVAHFLVGPFSQKDWSAQWIGDRETPVAPENVYYNHSGYRSEISDRADLDKWIVIDLGAEQSYDEVKLYPLPKSAKLFPLRFRIETSSNSKFGKPKILADESENDVTVQESTPYAKKFPAAKGRYIRVKVSKSPAESEGKYGYGLAEIEVLNSGKNIALNRQTQASDYMIVNGNWEPCLLTDGYLKPTGLNDYFANIPPSPLLRKEISINKKIRRAFYYTSALGIYEAYINGQKVGKQIFAPEFTDYDSHLQYQTHEVSGLLQNGANVLGATLADGWYAGARWSHPWRGGYGFFRKFLGQLMIYYEDGTSETVVTDNSWKYLAQGPVTEASYFKGEIYEAKNEQKGWDKPGYSDSQWTAASAYPDEKTNLCAQMNEPVTVIKELEAVSLRKIDTGKYIFDMGQNMVGWCEISLPYNPGKPVTLRYSEMLKPDGSLYMANMRAAKPEDVYHPDREQSIRYEPKFTYHGFRYVEVSGLTQSPQLDIIRGKMVASSSPETGTFSTSNRDVNKLWENIRWTQWGNLISIPTDCPQRDEREGYLADAQIFSQTAIYNLDMAGFYTKWVRDISDSQLEDGRFPDYAPHDGKWRTFFNAPGWADGGVIIPWRVYQNYNDTEILSKQYESMKKFVDFNHRHNPDLIWRNIRAHNFGDWLNGNTIRSNDYPKTGGQVPDDVFATGYFFYSTDILAKTAKLLGKTDDYKKYSALASSIRKVFNEKFVSADGVVEGNTQAGYALALQFGLLPEELRSKAAANMVEAIKAYDYRISTGIHSTIWMMKQLSEYGYDDVAYQLLLSRRFPSWFYSIDQGATTIWERWDGYVAGRGFQSAGMNSFNHVAIGAVGEWMYSHILGIRFDESQPGYRHFFIKPQPGKALEWAKGSYHAITGNIEVSWTNKDRTFTMDVNIPVNTEATIVTPFDNKTYNVGSGKHSYTVKYEF